MYQELHGATNQVQSHISIHIPDSQHWDAGPEVEGGLSKVIVVVAHIWCVEVAHQNAKSWPRFRNVKLAADENG